MSHLVSVQTRLTDAAAIAAACKRLELPGPTQGTVEFYSGTASGLLVQLPGWQYPAVIDTSSGLVQLDTYEGRWGEERHLHRLLHTYVIEKCRLEALAKRHTFCEQPLEDGFVLLRIIERG
jgi:hypothetical protein